MADDAVIRISDLKFNYGRLPVINGVSLDIPRGISFGLLGSNGAGKTTLIRLMVGLLKPASGNVRCLGKAPTPSNARNIGYMPQLASSVQRAYGQAEYRLFRPHLRHARSSPEICQSR